MVPGIGPRPDKMLLGRLFSYADTHRYRIGPNYAQLPPNRPARPVHTYAKDGAMRYGRTGPTRSTRPTPTAARAPTPSATPPTWHTDGEIMRSAYTLHPEDDDWASPARWSARCSTTPPVPGWSPTSPATCSTASASRSAARLQYWRNVDKDLGDTVEQGVRAGQS